MSEYTYDAFISYRHVEHDKAVAKKLHTLIETYGIPSGVAASCGKKKMGKVFRDEEELPLAVSLSENIETALRQSEWLIVICSPDYLTSRWCMKEVDYFISLGRRDHILLVLARGTPETSFPPQLTKVETEEGEKDVEPLAANIASEDTKESLSRLSTEKLRILAPMLGVGYDDLKRRARQRRIRITAAIAAAVILLGTGAGIYVASQNRKKAELKIGELIEKAESSLSENERIAAAGYLTEALEYSKKSGSYRIQEIESALRRTLYIEPFSQLSGFSGQSIRIIDAVAVPGGSKVLGIVNNNSVALVDCIHGGIEYEVSVSNKDIAYLTASPDGSRFMAVTDNCSSATVWNTADGKEVFRYTSKAGSEFQIANAFFLDDDTLLIQDFDRFYTVKTDGSESLIYTLGSYKGSYDPDDNFLTRFSGRSIKNLITTHTDDYVGTNVAVSADRSRILIGGKDGSSGVVIIDTKGSVICELEDMPGVFSDVYCFTPDGKYAIGTSYFNCFGVWDAATGKKVYAYALNSEFGLTMFSKVAVSPDSSLMAFVADNVLYVINIGNSSLVLGGQIEDNNTSAAVEFSDDGNYLFLRNQSLMIVDVRTGRILKDLEAGLSSAYNNSVTVYGGKGLFVSRNDGNAALLAMPSVSSVSSKGSFDGELATDINAGYKFNGGTLISEHTLSEGFLISSADKGAAGLYTSADGKYAVLSYADGVFEVFIEKDGGKVSRKISEYQSRASSISLSSGILAACHQNGKILVYDIEAGTVKKIWNTGIAYYDIILSPDGAYFMAMESSLDTIDIYSCEKGLLFSMTDPAGFKDMAFSKDGSYAVGIKSSGYAVGEMLLGRGQLEERAKLLLGN